MNLNKIMLIGNLGRDAEIKRTNKGVNVAEMAVATQFGFGKDSRPIWHKVNVWGKLAEKTKGMKKGNKVFVEGKLVNRVYEKDGQRVERWEILADNVGSVDLRGKDSGLTQ
jgi:single-strand DNA-binding protein